jgi:hypothetical protein
MVALHSEDSQAGMQGATAHRRELKERGKKEENREDIGLLW